MSPASFAQIGNDEYEQPVFDRDAALALPPGPALRAFFRIADGWQLKRAQAMALLGIDGVSMYSSWKREPDEAKLKLHVIERLSYVLGIYDSLQTLLPGEAAESWVHRPNSATPFGGRPAIELMTSGLTSDLAAVRQYLDGERYR